MRFINGSYQFVKETRGADYPDMWFPEPVPEPRVTAVDVAVVQAYLTNSHFIGLVLRSHKLV